MYCLTMRASCSESVVVPRALRMNFAVRLIMPCRLPAWAVLTLPVAVSLKRFLAPDFVFSLGILRPFLSGPRAGRSGGCWMLAEPPRHARIAVALRHTRIGPAEPGGSGRGLIRAVDVECKRP